MRFDLSFARTYPHPAAKVWRALINPVALAVWLMETNFSPEVGRAFQMWCENDQGSQDLYLCKVLTLEPPARMIWSWCRDGQQATGETTVEFRLDAIADGTRLTIRHAGDHDTGTIKRLKGGWPTRLEELFQHLSSP